MRRLPVLALFLLSSAIASGWAALRFEVSPTGFSIRGYVEQELVEYGGFSMGVGMLYNANTRTVDTTPYLAVNYSTSEYRITVYYSMPSQTVGLGVAYVWR